MGGRLPWPETGSQEQRAYEALETQEHSRNAFLKLLSKEKRPSCDVGKGRPLSNSGSVVEHALINPPDLGIVYSNSQRRF